VIEVLMYMTSSRVLEHDTTNQRIDS
jgi:hypothetical protein